jgi:ornithine cyclodeaminase
MLFDDPPGDCHVKFGRLRGEPYFVVKVATGFYDNPALGLPVNDGLSVVLSTATGAPEAILLDQGWLTSWRTAAAGAIAARALAPRDLSRIGVFGSGHQAELQVRWLAYVLPTRSVMIFARDATKGAALCSALEADGFDCCVASSPAALLAECRLIVTATNAPSPLFDASDVRPGTHINAVGADSYGKQELDPNVFARAAIVAADDLEQCADHGDLSYAIAAACIAPSQVISLGQLLADGVKRDDAAITVADLTGVAFQDAIIAGLFVKRLRQA